MEVLGDLHGTMSFQGLYLRQMGDQEPIAEILDKFTKLAEVPDAVPVAKDKTKWNLVDY